MATKAGAKKTSKTGADKPDQLVVKQYELVINNIQFLDAYVPKVVAVYLIVFATVIVKFDAIANSTPALLIALGFIGLFTAWLTLILCRVSMLVREDKITKCTFENRYAELDQEGKPLSSLPKSWEERWSTSRLCQAFMVVVSIVCAVLLIFARLWPGPPPAAP
jgi:hypothetical protein